MLKIFKYLKGYVKIVADGFFIERFINLCLNKNILLWDIKRIGETRISAKVFISDFKKLRTSVKKTGTKIKIIKRCGMPFIFFKYRKRKLALFGVLLIIMMFMFYSNHVMGIDIKGNDTIPKQKILNTLKEFGIYSFAPIKNIDRQKVQNEMMSALDEISWIGVNVRGSRVYIEVRERIKTPQGVNLNMPCDLIAKKNGIIRELDIRQGQSMVKKSEFVEKGDLLVSGAVDSEVFGIRYLHSFGEVFAETLEEKEKEYELSYFEKKYTGNEKIKYSIMFNEKNIGFNFSKGSKYKLFDKKEDFLVNDLFGFFSVKKEIYKEQVMQKVTLTEKQAFEKGKKELTEKLKKEMSNGAEIKNVFYEYKLINKNKIKVKVSVSLLENIATERAIDKTENMNYTN